jgi:hypothetical protein
MKTKSIILAALCALAASALADEFHYSFSGVMDKFIASDTNGTGIDLLTSINGPTDFTLSFTLNYLNEGGAYTLQGLTDFSVSVAGWVFTDSGWSPHYFRLYPNGPATDLYVQSDTVAGVRTDSGFVRAEFAKIYLRGLAGTDPNDISGFTEGSVNVCGYSWAVDAYRKCDYVLNGTLSPVADAGSVLPLLLVGVTALFVSRRCLLR